MITFRCVRCFKELQVFDEALGTNVRCPGCGAVIVASPTDTAVADRTTNAWDFLDPPQQPDEIGRFGSCRVLKVLGAGTRGVTFRAEDMLLERLVALKVLPPALASDSSARDRFLREARMVGALEHHHIVTTHQVGECHGIPFLLMELLDGESLEARIRRSPGLTVPEITRIGREIAEGLAAAHARGLVHCAIKPAHIWLGAAPAYLPTAVDHDAQTPGRVKILGFGLARAAGANFNRPADDTDTSALECMAPELAAGGPSEIRSDLFSLGCVLYGMCTGQMPFQGADAGALLVALTSHHPPPIAHGSWVPEKLSDLVTQLLAKKPDQRPPSALAVVKALRAIEQPLRSPPVLPRRIWPWFAGGNVLAFAILVCWLAFRGDAPQQPPTPGKETSKTPTEPVPTKPAEPTALRCTTVLTGHTDDIRWLAFNPRNGQGLASCSQDRSVRVWDLTGAKQAPLVLTGHPHHVISLDWRGDGKMLASGGEGGIILWRAADGEKVANLKGQPSVSGLAFSGDGARLASSSYDQTVRVWNPDVPLEAPLILSAPRGKTANFSSVAWGNGNEAVYAVSGDGRLFRWDLLNPTVPDWVQAHQARIETVAVAPDGQTVASAGYDRTTRLWTKELKPAGELAMPWGHVLCVAFSPDGRLIATCGEDGCVRVWDRATRNLLGIGTGHASHLWAIAFSPNSRLLASGGGDRSVRLWDIAEFTPR